MKTHTGISLFVTEKVRNAFSRELLPYVGHVREPFAEHVTQCFCLALFQEEFEDFRLVCSGTSLGSLFHDFTVQTESKFLYCTPSEVDILFNILDLYLAIHVKHNVYAVCPCSLPSQFLSATK